MKRRLLLLVLMCGALSSAWAQSRLDSLKDKLARTTNDSLRFVLLLAISEESDFYDFQKARQFAEEATEIAKKINQPWSLGLLNSRLGILESTEGDYADALRLDQACVQIYTALGDSTKLAKALNDVGQDYRDLGEYAEGYSYLTRSYNTARTNPKGSNHSDSLIMAVAIHNIGNIFTELGQYDVALSHLLASQKMSVRLNDLPGQPYTDLEMGELYRRKGDLDLAEQHLKASMAASLQLRIRVVIPRIYTNMARLYADRKEFGKSLAYYDSVDQQSLAVNNRFALAQSKLGRGMVLYRSGQKEAALKLYMECLEAARHMNAQILTLECYKELSRLYQDQRDFQHALSYLSEYNQLRDTLFSRSSLEKLFQDQIRFETANKDTEIAALSQLQTKQSSEIRKQELIQNILVIVMALVVILLFSVYRSSRRRKRINKLLLEHQQEIRKRTQELEQLNQVKDKFFSIISHDLRSPMNALGASLDLLEHQHVTKEEFAMLTKNLRNQFTHTRTLINNLLDWALLQMDKLRIQPEIITLSNTVTESIESLRELFPKNITMHNKVQPTVMVIADANILSLVLRNLILNAIKFTQAGGEITVDAVAGEKEVTVSVADNGIGIRPEILRTLFHKTSGYSTRGTANEKGTGLGLILCQEFVEKNGGRIWVTSEPAKGSTFYFTIPVGS